MEENIIIIDYLERVHKANRPKDFKKLLSVQIKLAKLEKENRILKDMVNKANTNNYYFSLEVAEIESKRLKQQSECITLREEIKTLKTQVSNLTESLTENI